MRLGKGLLRACRGWSSLIMASVLITNTLAKTDAPQLTSKAFTNVPENPEYFDDSDVILIQDWVENDIYRSEDAGEHWKKIEDFAGETAWTMYMHPFNNKRAYVLTNTTTHWRTDDKGATWNRFFADAAPSVWRSQPLSFHADDPDKIIFNGQDCLGIFCEEIAMYTTDGFRSDAKVLRGETAGCHWVRSTKLFTTGEESKDAQRTLCVTKGKYSPWVEDYRLLISDNYFIKTEEDDGEFEPDLEPGQRVNGVVNMAVIKKYLVAATTSKNTDEMALYVTDDTIKWHRAIFPHDHKLTETAYTILESTSYSIQVDVMSDSRISNPMGVLLSSNSNGTYFTRNIEHTNRNTNGYVDFEKMAGVQGIIFVNTVDNYAEVQKTVDAHKKVQSSVSFDDGRTWESLSVGNERLHLHMITDISNIGRVLSSPAPGLVMGVGNTGKSLKTKAEGSLYVSDDAGRNWALALEGPHKYEFGDQGSVLVAVLSGKATDVINYSLNHGKTWTSVDLPVQGFRVELLTTTSDSTSLKFLLTGGTGFEESTDKPYTENYVISIDFAGMHERKCDDGDFEKKWYARVDDDGNPTCLMGHKQYYVRRLKDADCFVMQEFDDPEVRSEPCDCADEDFECDFNFILKDGKCDRDGDLIIPEGACKGFNDETTFDGSSGYRLIPGNDCKRVPGKQLDDLTSWKCSEAVGGQVPPADQKVTHNLQRPFKGENFMEKIYLERTDMSSGFDESIVARTKGGHIYLSKDHGKTWAEILEDITVKHIISNPYFSDMIYFLTSDGDVYYSTDRGDNIRQFGSRPGTYPDTDYPSIMSFHPKHKDWIIWVGVKDKECVNSKGGDRDCHAVASWTDDRGDHWRTLRRYVRKCEFIPAIEGQRREEKLIYCDVKANESPSDDNNPWQLVSSENFFDTEQQHFNDIIGFATMSEFIIVAKKDETTLMKAEASVDGSTFAEALFPSDLEVPQQSGYTALQSSTHAVFLLVTVEPDAKYKYGTLIKSNSNGTSYVLSLNAVNQDESGYADYEKSLGIEGVALANVLANSDTVKKDGAKLIKTMITHNDGADWDYLSPPKYDSEKNLYGCGQDLTKCSVHIHGYTERKYKSQTYSSPTAVGNMVGIGNVGEYLGPKDEADTFISIDAGITWNVAMKGPYMWEFGDQGSIIVLVNALEETRVIHYSLDEGRSWTEYPFADEPMIIDEITTVPSDNSRNFVLWASTDDGLATVNIDFSGLTDRECELDDKNPEAGDYYLWTPSHPKQKDDCIFGHISQYHRKRTENLCYNGRIIDRLHNIADNCLCERRDFECDYNFERHPDGSCILHEGSLPSSHLAQCDIDPDMIEYWESTGYRRIPITTCVDGQQFDKSSKSFPCPKKQDEYNRKHGTSWLGVFFAVVISLAIAISAGWWVWRNWEGKFGQIRLGESTFDEQAPYIKYPVLAISAIVAIIITLPSLIAGAWRGTSALFGRGRTARFTTRSSFARGADYAPVDDDEGELLGDESDEEV